MWDPNQTLLNPEELPPPGKILPTAYPHPAHLETVTHHGNQSTALRDTVFALIVEGDGTPRAGFRCLSSQRLPEGVCRWVCVVCGVCVRVC